MQHDHVQKTLNYDLLIPSPRVVGGRGVCGQDIGYSVSLYRDSLQFDMQHDHALKKVEF